MATNPIYISLPIADRPTSFAFYREALGLEAVGEPADDGVPEPLQFELGGGVMMMLIPTGGFGWVIGDNELAPAATSECLLTVAVGTEDAVDATMQRAQEAGATVVGAAGPQPWGYVGTFADPDGHLWMVTGTSFPS